MRKPVLDWKPDTGVGWHIAVVGPFQLRVFTCGGNVWDWTVAKNYLNVAKGHDHMGDRDVRDAIADSQVAAEDALRKHLADLVPVMQKLGMLEGENA